MMMVLRAVCTMRGSTIGYGATLLSYRALKCGMCYQPCGTSGRPSTSVPRDLPPRSESRGSRDFICAVLVLFKPDFALLLIPFGRDWD
eukprot:406471-Rhodomonas_salina.1